MRIFTVWPHLTWTTDLHLPWRFLVLVSLDFPKFCIKWDSEKKLYPFCFFRGFINLCIPSIALAFFSPPAWKILACNSLLTFSMPKSKMMFSWCFQTKILFQPIISICVLKPLVIHFPSFPHGTSSTAWSSEQLNFPSTESCDHFMERQKAAQINASGNMWLLNVSSKSKIRPRPVRIRVTSSLFTCQGHGKAAAIQGGSMSCGIWNHTLGFGAKSLWLQTPTELCESCKLESPWPHIPTPSRNTTAAARALGTSAEVLWRTGQAGFAWKGKKAYSTGKQLEWAQIKATLWHSSGKHWRRKLQKTHPTLWIRPSRINFSCSSDFSLRWFWRGCHCGCCACHQVGGNGWEANVQWEAMINAQWSSILLGLGTPLLDALLPSKMFGKKQFFLFQNSWPTHSHSTLVPLCTPVLFLYSGEADVWRESLWVWVLHHLISPPKDFLSRESFPFHPLLTSQIIFLGIAFLNLPIPFCHICCIPWLQKESFQTAHHNQDWQTLVRKLLDKKGLLRRQIVFTDQNIPIEDFGS